MKIKILAIHLLTSTVVVLLGVLVLGFLGKLWWLFEILSHFYNIYFLFFVLFFLASVWLKNNFLAVGSALGLLISGFIIFPVYFINSGTRNNNESLRVMSLNTNYFTSDLNGTLNVVSDVDPDIIVLLEPEADFYIELYANLLDEYPHHFFLNEENPSNMAILSRDVFSKPEIFSPSGTRAKLMRVVFNENNKNEFALYTVHPIPPFSKDLANERIEYYEEMSLMARQEKKPTIMIGDFNTSPWSPLFRKLVVDSGLRDTRDGFGIQSTWPTYMPNFLRIPIDHALVSSEIIVNDRFVPKSSSSDHSPIVIDISF